MQPKDDKSAEEFTFFRLRLKKELGDEIADLAWQARRSVNSQVIVLLEKALGKETSSVVETPHGRGAKTSWGKTGLFAPNAPARDTELTITRTKNAGGKKTAEKETFTPEQIRELKELHEKLNYIFGASK